MKIALSIAGTDPDSPLDSRFGRAEAFLVYDLETDTVTVVDNQQNLNAAQGAGIQAAQNVVNSGAKAVVTGHCGPKAFRVLDTAGIAVYTCTATTVAEALTQFRAGMLTALRTADVEGHWA